MRIFITSAVSRNAGEEIDVTFEITADGGEHTDRETFTVSSSQYLTLGISKGESDEEKYDEVLHAAEVWSAVKKGVSLLGYGSCSEKALRMKLVGKGFDREICAEAVEKIVAMGLLRACDDALREAQRQAEKLWGRRRIIAELYRKGYDAEAVASAMQALDDSCIDYAENCARLISRSYRRALTDPDGQKKIYAALMRYGYSPSEIKQALKTSQ